LPYLDRTALAKLVGDPAVIGQYLGMVGYVAPESWIHRAGEVWLSDRSADDPISEELELLDMRRDAWKGRASLVENRLADWTATYPNSRLQSQACVIGALAKLQYGQAHLRPDSSEVSGEIRALLEEARKELEDLVDTPVVDPFTRGEALYFLGGILEILGQSGESEVVLRELIETMPTHPSVDDARYRLALGSYHRGDFDDSRNELERWSPLLGKGGPLFFRVQSLRHRLDLLGTSAPAIENVDWYGDPIDAETSTSSGGPLALLFFTAIQREPSWGLWECNVPLVACVWPERFAKQGIRVIGVLPYSGRSPDKVSSCLEAAGIAYPCAIPLGRDSVARAYGVEFELSVVVIDAEGTVVWNDQVRFLSEDRLDALLEPTR